MAYMLKADQGSGRWWCARPVKMSHRNLALRANAFKLQYVTVLIAARLLMPTENCI